MYDSKNKKPMVILRYCFNSICLVIILLAEVTQQARLLQPPIVINTWNFTHANQRAWRELVESRSAIDAIEAGCSQCEEDRCDGTVGWGGSPDESGETSLDAMIMDGQTYDVGAVGGLRRVKNAISVARMVLERTEHTLLVGDMATQFAISMGFKEQSLYSNESKFMFREWLSNDCQPNYWKNVSPDPKKFCGPYKPKGSDDHDDDGASEDDYYTISEHKKLPRGHDTIGMIAVDSKMRIASGTSTNGQRYKIPGRVGDSPVPGAGSYAAHDAGAAAATGDGDVMMRFLLSYQAVENLRRGMTAQHAAIDVIRRQVVRTGRPYPQAAIVVLGKSGDFGAACCGFKKFPYVISHSKRQIWTNVIDCLT